MRNLIVLVASIMALAVAGCVTNSGQDSGVQSASLEVPGKLSNLCSINGNPFSGGETSRVVGVYDGHWSGKLEQTVIIYEAADSGRVKTYYAHGAYRQWGIDRADCVPVGGTIHEDGRVVLDPLPNGAVVTYNLQPDGKTLYGEYELRGSLTLGTFERVTPL